MTGQFVPVRINAEKEGVAVAKKYQVQGFPTILFLNSDGQVEGTIGGYLPAADFSEQLTQIQADHQAFPVLRARLMHNPKDGDAAARLAAIYAGRSDPDKAAAMLQIAEQQNPTNPVLARAYNAMGDYYQGARKFTQAIPNFQKAARVGNTPHDVAYADISLAQCYGAQGNLKDTIAALKATVAVPGCPPDLKDQALSSLDRLQKTQQ